ncbi:MAG: hypothetical protein J3Q66DRAFT_366439 [Benniella sp.]|nr:MAG: hypothetical protein J3Q66DRAFT_366439 [Benniella sp.]
MDFLISPASGHDGMRAYFNWTQLKGWFPNEGWIFAEAMVHSSPPYWLYTPKCPNSHSHSPLNEPILPLSSMIDFNMFDLSDPKLSKSADALESALAQLGKNADPFAALDSNAGNLLASSPVNASISDVGSGFDEWLAKDFQFGTLPGDDSIASSLASSPLTALDDSPELGFEALSVLMGGPSLFEMNLGFSGNNNGDLFPAVSVASSPVISAPAVPVVQPKAFSSALTSAAVQQAAAALNIPYSPELEEAVMAQARAQVAVAAATVPVLPINNTPAMIIPKSEPLEQSVVITSPVPSAAAVAKGSSSPSSKKRAFSPEEESDEVVLKRAKNTDAARRSRMKKLMRLETLEGKVSELESTNNRLTMKVAILETEKNAHLVKEAEQSARIAQLEAKLAEAHAALTSRA